MPRELCFGNGDLMVTLDADLAIRDLYFPFVGMENHVGGHRCRLGVWVDGHFSWVDEALETLDCIPPRLAGERGRADAPRAPGRTDGQRHGPSPVHRLPPAGRGAEHRWRGARPPPLLHPGSACSRVVPRDHGPLPPGRGRGDPLPEGPVRPCRGPRGRPRARSVRGRIDRDEGLSWDMGRRGGRGPEAVIPWRTARWTRRSPSMPGSVPNGHRLSITGSARVRPWTG